MPVQGICYDFQFVQSMRFFVLAKLANYGLLSYYPFVFIQIYWRYGNTPTGTLSLLFSPSGTKLS